ncbi:MAG TPA: T9SS type A sorting domain-containing protein, partial [Bacteroidales bacterium]|nr:T9SS type A sorting domain-containing protein [Bacteroidales bacterium]
HQEGVNEIEQLHNQIISLQSARQVNYDHLMRATFKADTTVSFADTYNYVIEFMETQTDYHAKNRLVDMYIHKGLYDKALNILDLMKSSLSDADFAKANDIHLTEIEIDILQNVSHEPILDIVKRYEDFLNEMAADYNTKEGGVARAILESAGLWDNFPIVFLPNPEGEISTKSAFIEPQEEEKPIVNYELESLFKLYPNPANDYLSVEFINPNGNCTFSIYSIKGELLKTISSNQQIGFISIDISNLSPGNYIINCPELQSKINFVVAR